MKCAGWCPFGLKVQTSLKQEPPIGGDRHATQDKPTGEDRRAVLLQTQGNP